MFLRLTPVSMCLYSSPLYALIILHCIDAPHFIHHELIAIWGCSRSLAIMSNAAIYVQVFV
jgi:hypothetical protein